MGSGQSTTKPAEMQEPDTGTQLFGSWDKPVAKAYALKKHASKKGNAVGSKAANAANAALGSAIELEAGAGVKPTGGQTPGKHKGAGVTQHSPSSTCSHLQLPCLCLVLCCAELCGPIVKLQHIAAHCYQPSVNT